ncbi:hypothetical protein MAIT1_02602 [Magnetofaba australis IT-1]|uniref:Uncharacterized protein n=1 Tax=Magnetofaba australis IT-1 TaxID=1434232 RepID=A0A1Y2K486_9PROT|nr:hypothetical protein MAIT1_02602 [Magnetofaba australis IT-1]
MLEAQVEGFLMQALELISQRGVGHLFQFRGLHLTNLLRDEQTSPESATWPQRDPSLRAPRFPSPLPFHTESDPASRARPNSRARPYPYPDELQRVWMRPERRERHGSRYDHPV